MYNHVWNSNPVRSKSGIRRTKPRYTEYGLKGSGFWFTKIVCEGALSGLFECTVL